MSGRLFSRRGFLRGVAGTAGFGLAGSSYAVGIEPMRLRVQRYAVAARAPWPAGLTITIAVLTDIHACEPWMSAARIESIVRRTNALGADLVVLLGDYVASQRLVTRYVDAAEWAPMLGALRAPLGVFAVLGNHDWWDDPAAQRRGGGPVIAGAAISQQGIRVLENEAVEIVHRDGRFWIAGLADQLALLPSRRRRGHPRIGLDDLAGTLAQVPKDAAAILLAHEPDIFPRVPERISLTLSGHTHGGQIRLFGHSPVVPSRYRNRYAYGHVREHTDLIVSGGLGCSIAPVRLGVPPEIVLVEIASGEPA